MLGVDIRVRRLVAGDRALFLLQYFDVNVLFKLMHVYMIAFYKKFEINTTYKKSLEFAVGF